VTPQPDLFLLKWTSAQEIQPGQLLTYTIAVGNAGQADAANVVVIDTLPAGVTYVEDTDNCREDPPGTLTCALGDIPPGVTVVFDIVVRVDESLAGSINNVAIVLSDTHDRDVIDQVVIVPTVLREVVEPTPSPTPVPALPTPGVIVPPAAGAKPSASSGGVSWWLSVAAGGLLALSGLAVLTKILGSDRR
jgi:uncharacterized repeat protein (TIGR01451 family)